MTREQQARLLATAELSRRSFYDFCVTLAPQFYKGINFLKATCNEMQSFIESDDEILVVNLPPRHGKSRTATLLTQWILGRSPQAKIMTGSYNETLSTTFSKAVRNGIQEVKADKDIMVYSDIFPKTKIKQGDGAMNLWSLEGGHNNYLATSPTGTATGFGANYIIIDDIIKNADEAYNEIILEKQWNWFTDTMLSRLEEGGKIIIVMTRWATNDLAGRALDHFKNKRLRHISMKALQDDGTMLCDEILSKSSYDMKVQAMGSAIASANYQQTPIDIEGRLYKNLKTYTELPPIAEIHSYTDTADQGKDYLCSIVYGVYQKQAYILDLLYTQEGMEITEPKTAEMLFKNDCQLAIIESNNGGRGFARTIERLLWENHKSRKPSVKWIDQSKNKQARIVSNSNYVMENVFLPVNWRDRWPEFYRDITNYQKSGKNQYNDGPDTLTGIVEQIQNKIGISTMRKADLGL